MKAIKVLRWLIALLLTLSVLSACSGADQPSKPVPSTSTATQPTLAANNANTTSNPAAPQTSTGSDTNAAEKPAQVSETGDDSETVDETTPAPTTQPSLKLAAGATPEGKSNSQFKEGVHYQRLVPTQPTNASPGQVEVLEIFWYGCSHCFALDSRLEAWRQKSKANYVAFQRLPATWNDAALFHGRLFYVAEQLGKLEELHTPLFREIHLNGDPLNTADKAKAFFAAHGVSKADFDKAFTSFGVNTKIQTAGLLNRRYHVEGVPFFVVNGKYTLDIGSAGGEEQALQLINELAAREHR